MMTAEQGARRTRSRAASRKVVQKSIAIVDDHPIARLGIRQLIESEPDLKVCCEADSPASALRTLARGNPDLLLTDLDLPGRGGLEFIKDVCALHPKLPILVLSFHDETLFAERVLRAGARGYIMKSAGGERLLAAVRTVLDGQVYLEARIVKSVLNGLAGVVSSESRSPFGSMTDRELEVFRLLGQGLSAKAIASQLNISPKTADVHRSRIKKKLGFADLGELISFAARWSLLDSNSNQ